MSISVSGPLRQRATTRLVAPLVMATGAFLAPSSLCAETFNARLTMDLCPEYQLGGVTIRASYSVQGSREVRDATVLNTTVNTAQQTATVDIELPAGWANKKLSVRAFCVNSFGSSPASNILQISNCDAIAEKDIDADGVMDGEEDLDCNNTFTPGDKSSVLSRDTDGDLISDAAELAAGTDPANAGSSTKPFIFAGAPFDPDGDGNSNAVVFRPSSGTWFVRDMTTPGNTSSFQHGLSGDVPFVYEPATGQSDVGVIRKAGNDYRWIFRGPGFERTDGTLQKEFTFGNFGDNIVVGPWERAGVTSPGLARLVPEGWFFSIYLRDGSIRTVPWGVLGDIPNPQDYDGDGLFDVAVFRPAQGKTYVIRSSDGLVATYTFGSSALNGFFRGDVTGDGKDDLTFFNPASGVFTSSRSEANFASTLTLTVNPGGSLLPLPWYRVGSQSLLTVVDHLTGNRSYRSGNSSGSSVTTIQWGLPGDAQG